MISLDKFGGGQRQGEEEAFLFKLRILALNLLK